MAEIRNWKVRIDNDENKVNERSFKLTQLLRFRGGSELAKLSLRCNNEMGQRVRRLSPIERNEDAVPETKLGEIFFQMHHQSLFSIVGAPF